MQIVPFAAVFSIVVFGGSSYTVSVIPPPSGYANANWYTINNSGQVAGVVIGGTSQTAIGSPSGSMVLPLPSGWSSSWGYGINNASQVAGFVTNGSNTQAFIFTTSGS